MAGVCAAGRFGEVVLDEEVKGQRGGVGVSAGRWGIGGCEKGGGRREAPYAVSFRLSSLMRLVS